MRIWITEIGEPLPLEPDARLLRYGILSPLLVQRGHEVTWWASTFSHSLRDHVRAADCEESYKGVRLKLLHGPGYKSSISLSRIRHQSHFARRFAEEAEKQPLPDLILTPIPTLEVARAAVEFGKRHNIPVLVDIRDEWPEEFVDLAPKGLRFLARLALTKQFRDASYICQNATGIVGTGRKFLEYGLKFAKRPLGANDALLPFGYPSHPIDKTKIEEATVWWQQHGVEKGQTIACFFGTMGNFFDFDPILKTARKMSGDGTLRFVLCGKGNQEDALRARSKDISSILLPGWVDAPKISALMGMATVGLAPYRKGARMALPNKPIEYFSGGLPVLSSLTGELAALIEREGCGLNYEADSEASFETAISSLIQNSQRRTSMAAAAKRVFNENFSAEQMAERMEMHFERVRRASIQP